MVRKTYDARDAKALIPLLRSITQEIQEREQEIDRLDIRAQALEGRAGTDRERTRLEAEAATHKRELRFALRELERLGCALDQDHPLRVLIPGSATAKGPGYAWSPEDTTIRAR